MRKRLGRGPLAAVLIFAGVLMPALGFFDVYPFRFSFVADHFQYHASIALLVLAAAALTPVLARLDRERHGAQALGVALLLLVLGVLTFCQTFVYYDLETLYADTIVKNPTSWTAYANLSMHFITVGRKTEAYALAERAIELAPEDTVTNGNLGSLLLADAISEGDASEKLAKAMSYFQKYVSLDAANLPARKGLGYALDEVGSIRRGGTTASAGVAGDAAGRQRAVCLGNGASRARALGRGARLPAAVIACRARGH